MQIENAAFATDRMSRRAFARRIASSSSDLDVCESDAGIVGYGLVEFRTFSVFARLFSIARAQTAPAGVGRALLASCEARAIARGRRAIRLEVREDNFRALRLYEKSGFRPIGRYDDYYEDGAPALRLEKALGTG
ncbi:MAG: GNAT family N-acetyltransferase [Rhodoblastus sp.]